MAQRITTAEKPAPKRRLGRMGCLVIISVILLAVVGTVFAPDFSRQAGSPSATPSPGSTVVASATLSDASAPEVLPVPSLTTELSATKLRETPLRPTSDRTPPPAPATVERTLATQVVTVSPTHTATLTPTLTLTSSPTTTPTAELILATNTHPPLVIVTNTPSTSSE